MGDLTFFSVILGLIASLFAIGATVVLVLRYLHQRSIVDGGEEPPLWRLIAEAGTVIAIILVVALVINNLAAANNGAGPNPTATLASGGNGSTNIGAGIPPTTTETATVGAAATATIGPFPTNVPDYGLLSSYGTATMTPNWRLECGGCDEPVRIQVAVVATDAGNENMIWTFTMDNHTAENFDEVYFNGSLQLTDPTGVKHYATGAAVTSPGASIRTGNSAQIQATFAFLPRHGATYTLTGRLIIDDGLFTTYIRDYGPQTITFP